jgi:biotin carboxyl carrier protein
MSAIVGTVTEVSAKDGDTVDLGAHLITVVADDAKE